MMIEITDEDIENIEFKLGGLSFDNESKEFIKCLDTKDIQACPGAGKTTSLVAKLGILSQYMPFGDNSGVLVLTHTNVAVDEIKEKLGIDANKLLGYPNHIGTFQSFINKYLAIPMYVKLTGKRPERIDSGIFNEKLLKKLKSYYLDNFIKMIMEANNYTSVEYFLKKLEVEDTRIVLLQQGNRRKNIVGKGKPSYANLKRALDDDIINNVIIDGYLTYEHCYELAREYLDDHPSIPDVFQKRFKYIFIDEAQDTDDRQFEILNRLFPESIVQKIGDNNQAIFSFSGQESSGWNIETDFIEIKNTKRLSSLIANQVLKIAVEPQELNGNDDIQILPTIILFDNPEDVLQKFSELIVEHDLHEECNAVFKAVGGVAKHNDNGDTLPSYYPLYSQRSNSSLDYDNLLDKLENSSIENIQLIDYKNIVLDVIVKYLNDKNVSNSYGNNKSFTKNSIQTFLRENHENEYNNFKLKLYEITEKLLASICIRDEIQTLLENILTLLGETIDSDTLNIIIKNYEIKFEKKFKSNVYKYEDGDINFDVEVSTIHKVKGETHTATLVLETFKDGYDLFQLLDYFKGKTNKLKLDNKKKLVYVAMSRPKYLVCLAMHKQHIHRKKNKEITHEDIDILETNGFRVIE